MRLWILTALLVPFVLRAGTNDLAIAKAALRDGLWQLARNHAEKAEGPEARLVVLESLAAEGNWKGVGEALADFGEGAKGAAFDYYRAAASGDFGRAADLLSRGGSPAGLLAAKMIEADLRVKALDRPAAERLWREVVASTNVGERAFALASVNLGETNVLRQAYARTRDLPLRRQVGLRLGCVLLNSAETAAEGERLVRAVVRDSPDVPGATEAYFALAEEQQAAGREAEALATMRDLLEIWPQAAKRPEVHLLKGDVLLRLRRGEEALSSFSAAEEVAKDEALLALSVQRQGDALSSLGKSAEAMGRYKDAVRRYPGTDVGKALARIVSIRELESSGREAFRAYRFSEARKIFARVAAEDPARAPRMAYCDVLCLYGLARDDEACQGAEKLAASSPDASVRAASLLWLAKFAYNRGEWREAARKFEAFAASAPEAPEAPDAMLWAVRALFAAGDYEAVIRTATQLSNRYPESAAVPAGLLVQSEALVEEARFDAAILVLEGVLLSKRTGRVDRIRAQMLKADALFAMGADNPARYEEALATYRGVRHDGALTPSHKIELGFKTGRVLEKLRKSEEAEEEFYVQVVLAYDEGIAHGVRYDDAARTAFSRAAFRLAERHVGRGEDQTARQILRLVAQSDVPAAEEAKRRLKNMETKGVFR